jgi:SAM-dependent methyltransferase
MCSGAVVSGITEQYVRYVAMLGLEPGDVALEAGCGTGRALAVAREHAPGSRWIGLDRLPRFVLETHVACPHAPLVLGDLRRLPFAADSFDAVFSRDTLECLPEAACHLDECARVLRESGRVLVSHWDWDTQVFNCTDIELTRSMVRAYADTPQGWMEHHDPAMGRKLHGLVRRHPRLQLVDAGVTVLLEQDWRAGTFGYEQSQAMAKFLPAKGVVSDADARRWLELLELAASTGDYLFSANHYWCLARRRDR